MHSTVTHALEFFIPLEGVVYRTKKRDYFCRMGSALGWDLKKFGKVASTVTTREIFSVATVEYIPIPRSYCETHTVLRAFEHATDMSNYLVNALSMYRQKNNIVVNSNTGLEKCFIVHLSKPLANGCCLVCLIFGSDNSAIILSKLLEAIQMRSTIAD